MKELVTRIEIDAPAAKVWETLMNFRDYPQWNPFVQYVRGEAKPGGTIHTILALPDGEPMVIHPEVLKVDPQHEFRWKGKFWLRGLFDSEHYFKVMPLTENRSLFIQGEIFSGILVPFLKKMLEGVTAERFKAMKNGLKARVEKKA